MRTCSLFDLIWFFKSWMRLLIWSKFNIFALGYFYTNTGKAETEGWISKTEEEEVSTPYLCAVTQKWQILKFRLKFKSRSSNPKVFEPHPWSWTKIFPWKTLKCHWKWGKIPPPGAVGVLSSCLTTSITLCLVVPPPGHTQVNWS